MNIVVDTNIIVSAILSPSGKPAQIINLVANSKRLKMFYSIDILSEYKRVLAYERLNIPKDTQSIVVKMITAFGILINPPISNIQMPDETDRTFYDTATVSSSILITGNIKHFLPESFIVTPAEFLEIFEAE